LLGEDWRLEMIKTLNGPESFFHKKFRNFFQAKCSKKEDAMLLVTNFATVSQIANHCQIPLAL